MNNTTHSTPDDPNDGSVEKRLKTRCRGVADDFYPVLLARALERIPYLQHGVVYTAREIYGEKFWKNLRENQFRRLAGEVHAHFVVKGKVPLRFASCRYCTTKRYMRI